MQGITKIVWVKAGKKTNTGGVSSSARGGVILSMVESRASEGNDQEGRFFITILDPGRKY